MLTLTELKLRATKSSKFGREKFSLSKLRRTKLNRTIL